MSIYASNRLPAGRQFSKFLQMAAPIGAFVALSAAFPAWADSTAASADDGTVRASSLEVRSRIASLEQVNVTAEKPLRADDDAEVAAASALVSELLAELEQLEESQRPD